MDRPVVLETENLRLRRGRYGYMLFKRHDDTIGRAIDLYGEWAQAECELLAAYIAPGDVVLDVGAHVGTHTLFFANAVGEHGHVLSFEPQSDIFAVCAANVALNECANVTLFRCGVGSQACLLVPRPNAAALHNFGAFVLDAPSETDGYWSQVNVVALDSLALPRCDLIKIDAEGMEIDVLRGADATVAAHRPCIYAENTDPIRSVTVCAWLLERNYRIFWHAAPAYNAANYGGATENIFGNATELNVLCLPAERIELPPSGLPESFEPQTFAPATTPLR